MHSQARSGRRHTRCSHATKSYCALVRSPASDSKYLGLLPHLPSRSQKFLSMFEWKIIWSAEVVVPVQVVQLGFDVCAAPRGRQGVHEGDGEREVVVTREQLASLMASSGQGEDEDEPDEEAGTDDDVDAVRGATEDA